jgi:hypothetical protein
MTEKSSVVAVQIRDQIIRKSPLIDARSLLEIRMKLLQALIDSGFVAIENELARACLRQEIAQVRTEGWVALLSCGKALALPILWRSSKCSGSIVEADG